MRYVTALILSMLATPALAQNYPSPTLKALTTTNNATIGGTLSVTGAVSSQIGSSITMSGATCNGTIDDTAAINSWLATLSSGAVVYIPPGKRCLINSANLSVPDHVTIEGRVGPQSMSLSSVGTASGSSGFLLNPAYTINLGSGSQLLSMDVLRAGITSSPTSAQVIAAVQTWGNELSVAITIPLNKNGVILRDLFILGFNTAIKAASGTFTIQDVAGDDYNGIDISSGGDNYYINNVRFEPYYAFGVPAASGAWARPGIAFNLWGGNTGGNLNQIFSFMYRNGIVFNNIGVTQLYNSGFERQASFDPNDAGNDTIGIRRIGHDAQTSDTNVYVNGFTFAQSVESVGETMLYAMSGGRFYLGGSTAVPTVLTVGGTPAVGDTISLTFAGDISVGPLVYTVISGDTATTIASRVSRMVDAYQTLIGAHVQSIPNGSTATVYWPSANSITLTASATGGTTVTTAAGTAQPGSYGQIVGADVAGDITPIFTIGPGAVWQINAPYFGNSGTLPSGWLSIDPTSITTVGIFGVKWSKVSPSNLSSCGTSPSITPAATDGAGTITEGATATGCTFTFKTPWWGIPDCVVSSPTGLAITSYSTSATALTISNASASGAKITYRCNASGN